MASKLKIKVNGLVHSVTASLDTPLLYVLHNELHLYGLEFPRSGGQGDLPRFSLSRIAGIGRRQRVWGCSSFSVSVSGFGLCWCEHAER
jgi:hypothetical protein